MTGKFGLTLFMILSVFLSFGYSKTIWQDKNIYSSRENIKAGDIIIIKINDISNMRFTVALNSSKTSTVTSNPDMTITAFLPKAASNRTVNYRDSTGFTERGQLNLSVASRVIRKGRGGTFTVRGIRTFSINGITNRIIVSGTIDPAVMKGRNVDSKYVADFRIEVKGASEGINIVRTAPKEGESAINTLTEKEKQQIIADYLQKILRELTR